MFTVRGSASAGMGGIVNLNKCFALCALGAVAVSAFADTDALKVAPADVAASKSVAVEGNVLSFPVPKVGLRIGGGQWNSFMIDGGVDVTFNVPVIPLPALRVDGEVWGEPGNFGKNRRGNAFSILGIQTVAMSYFGYGPSFYFTDDNGDRRSGFGLKLVGGISLPQNAFVEAGILLGPSTPPIFFSIGERF